MNVSLTPELERLIDGKVKSGMYQTASEVVREGLRLLKERDDSLKRLQADVRAGLAAAERGDYDEFDERTTRQLAADIKAKGRQNLARKRRPAG